MRDPDQEYNKFSDFAMMLGCLSLVLISFLLVTGVVAWGIVKLLHLR
jgi:hypothetical protein